MIIWSGLGILIPLVAIFGIFVGGAVSVMLGHPGVGPGIGMGVAALANWGLWRLVYPKHPRILVDPATGQQVVMMPKHSLFFIPAKAWTWVLAVLAVPLVLMGGIGDRATAREEALPGCKEFKAANQLISTNSKGGIHGNSDKARAAAAEFATAMKTMTDAMFTGGSKKNLMTGGDFLTYCHEDPESIVFLCHVPSLRSYKSDEAKDGLDKVAWTAANLAASKLDPDQKKNLMIGLRGVVSYGSILQAKTGVESPAAQHDGNETTIFYPVFATVTAESKVD